MPAACQVVTDFGTVFQVAGAVELGICITAALDAKELERVFKNGVIDRRMNMECGRGVFSNNKEVLACCRKRRKVGFVKRLSSGCCRIAELVERSADRFEGATNPNGWLGICSKFLQVSTTGNFLTRISVDHLKCRFLGVGNVGVFIVLRPKACLVDADGAPVIDI